MCYHHEEEWREEGLRHRRPPPTPPPTTNSAAVIDNLRRRLADIEARLALARAREAALSRQLNDAKRFVSVMEILETYLNRRFREQQHLLSRLLSSVSA
ncbi:hypothetical protein RND81_13G216900 [Saponaria officinalis]|uniref:Protein SKIP34 n=1 Tax=Saponaria officinalis TaxID=3572 RepID=A0AAW1H461_SAPOF